jgi:hypothetical protein
MNAADALRRLAAFGLPGACALPVVVEPLDALISLAERRRVLSWVLYAAQYGMVANATAEFEQELRVRHLAAVHTTMAAHAAAAAVAARLAAVGIDDVRVLKGCATGHLDYERATDRFSSDVDLLIPTCDLDRLALAFTPGSIPEPRRRRWQERYGKSTTVIDTNGVEIDLHVQIASGYFGLAIPTDALRRDPACLRIGDMELDALDGPNRLLHAAVHVGGSHHYNLNSARDVLQLALVSNVGHEETVERAIRWKVDAMLAAGVRRAWTDLAVEPHPLSDWADRHTAAGRQRLALQVSGNGPGGPFLTAPLALPLHRWPGYLVPMLFPSRAYLAANGDTWTTRLRKRVREFTPG